MKKENRKIEHIYKPSHYRDEDGMGDATHTVNYSTFEFKYLLRTPFDDVLIDFQKTKDNSKSNLSDKMFDKIWNEILERRLPVKRMWKIETEEESKVDVGNLIEIDGGITFDGTPSVKILDVLSYLRFQ